MPQPVSVVRVDIPREYLVAYVAELRSAPVGHNHVAALLELVKIPDHLRVEEALLSEHRLVNHDLNSLRLDALHDALDRG